MKKTGMLAAGIALAGSTAALGESVFSSRSLRIRSGKKTNILLIAVDDLRTQLGCYGHTETISPNIDKIAAQGTVFSRAYCQVPVCGASRASLLTGIRPDYAVGRFTSAGSRADRDTPDAVTMQEHFKNNGYHSIANGKIHHYINDSISSWSEPPYRVYDYATPTGADWAKYNFDKIWLDPESKNHVSSKGRGPYREAADVPDHAYEDGKVAMKTIHDLRRLKKIDKPFFLACGFSRPHLPFNAPKKYYDMYDRDKLEIADNRYKPTDLPSACKNSGEINSYSQISGWPSNVEFHRDALHAYYACVSYVDAMIGQIMAELTRLDLDDNTIVLLWGDHGWHLGEHNFWGKHNTLNNALQVPLIFRAPGHKKNNTTDALVEFIDIYPTLCQLTRLPAPTQQLEGTSFVPLLKNPKVPWKQQVYSEWQSGEAVKTDRYLYTEWTNGSKMLFDHKTDPDENINIAYNPENADIVNTLSLLLNNI